MPANIQYQKLSQVIPPQRLSMYKKVFNTTNDLELYGAYLWSIKASSSLASLIGVLEIALRNSIHISATHAIGNNWYETLATRVRKQWKLERNDKANIAWHNDQVKNKKKRLAEKTPPTNLTKHDQLVAKMEFGFWVNLLSACFFDNNSTTALWPKCIPLAFPNLSKSQTHTTIQKKIDVLRVLRNDVAHNAPVWKHSSVRNEQDSISYLNMRVDEVLEVLSWLSMEKVNWIEVHMLVAEARRIISKEYLRVC